MSIIGRNWMEEGLYEEDHTGELWPIQSEEQAIEAAKKGNLKAKDSTGFSSIEGEDAAKEAYEQHSNKKY